MEVRRTAQDFQERCRERVQFDDRGKTGARRTGRFGRASAREAGRLGTVVCSVPCR
jgi:hypothetical protein